VRSFVPPFDVNKAIYRRVSSFWVGQIVESAFMTAEGEGIDNIQLAGIVSLRSGTTLSHMTLDQQGRDRLLKAEVVCGVNYGVTAEWHVKSYHYP
jgi:hypothetical protein